MTTDRPKRPRRARGEGGVHQRKDGLWEASLDIGWEGATRKRKRIYGKTEAEVKRKLNIALADRERGILITTADVRMDTYLLNWLENTIKVSRTERTYESYKAMIESHIIPIIGNLKLGKLTPTHVRNMMAAKSKDGLSARTVNYLRAVLRSALSQARDEELVHRNVASIAKPVTGSKTREPMPLSVEQARAFFKQIEGDRFEAAYLIAANLGLRRGEILGLRWQDVDLENESLRVRQQVQRVGNVDKITQLKTKASERTLPLPPNIAKALEKRKDHQTTEKALAGTDWIETGLVFTNTKGGIQNPANFYAMYKRHIQAVGIVDDKGKSPTFHDLRHTATSMLVRQGVQPRVAMEILGHSNIAVTMDVYAHVVEDSMRSAITAVSMGYDDSEKPDETEGESGANE